jgi:hypothetical protein
VEFIIVHSHALCRRARWSMAEEWAPCALGMLPSPHSPSGSIPTLSVAPTVERHELAMQDGRRGDAAGECAAQPSGSIPTFGSKEPGRHTLGEAHAPAHSEVGALHGGEQIESSGVHECQQV